MENLEKMEKSLETYSLPKLSQEETDNLNRLITRSEIESVTTATKNLQTKVQDQTVAVGNSNKHINNLYLSFSNSSKRLKMREHSQIHSTKPPSPWYQNQIKNTTEKGNYKTGVFDDYRCKKSWVEY